MADFITNGATELPAVKTDARSPTGSTDEVKAADLNQVRQALLDLRTEAISESTTRAAADTTLAAADTALSAVDASLDTRITTLEASIAGTIPPLTGLSAPIEVSGTDALVGNPAAVYLPWTAPDTTVSDRNPKGLPGVGAYENNAGSGVKVAVYGGDGGRASASEVFNWAHLKAQANNGAELSLQTARGTFGNQEHTNLRISLVQTAGPFGHAPQASFGDQQSPPPGLLIFVQRAQFVSGGILLTASNNSLWRLIVDAAGALSTSQVLVPSAPTQSGADILCTATAEGVSIYLVGYPINTTDYETYQTLDATTSGPAGATTFAGVLTALAGQSWTFYCYEDDPYQGGYKNVGGSILTLDPVVVP